MLSLGDFLLRSRQTPYPVFFLKAAPGLKSFLGVLFICCSLSSCALTPFKDNSIHGGKEEVAIINTGEETNPAVSPLPEDATEVDVGSETGGNKQGQDSGEPASMPPPPPPPPPPASAVETASRRPASAMTPTEPQPIGERPSIGGASPDNNYAPDLPTPNGDEHYETDAAMSISHYDDMEHANIDIEVIPIAGSAPSASVDELYKVELAVDKNMKIPGIKGELRVWIGGIDQETATPDDFAINTSHIPAIADFVLVTPRAPDFDIEAQANTNSCFEIHPTGSTVRFTLTPKKAGMFRVSADIKLFQTPDCSGAHVPKAAETLSVNVEVDRLQVVYGKVGELGDILWRGVLDFWTGVVALIIGLFLFLIRKRLAAWFGYHPQ